MLEQRVTNLHHDQLGGDERVAGGACEVGDPMVPIVIFTWTC